MAHPNLSPELNWVTEQPSIDVSALEPGQHIRLELAEGGDNERYLTLVARINDCPPDGECPELEVVYSEVPDETADINRKYELPNPDFIGQKFLLRGGCSKSPGGFPSMVHISSIDQNRTVWLAFELPESAKARSMEYFPFVRSVSLLPKG